MSEYDVVIRGGTVVDGTNVPRFRADVGIKDGRIVQISGRITAGAGQEIDASGCIVAPGAIDLHTHYDAQLNWDPYATLDGWFGVTTVTIGQCGFGFAPVRPDDRDLSMRMMNRIEAIPLESMRLGLRWDWETYPEYLDSLDRQGLGVNVASLFPFSPLRAYVMGMMESRRATSATPEQVAQIKQLFREGMAAGSFGFAVDKNEEDRNEDGGAIPSHNISDEEALALAEVLGEFGVGFSGWTIGISDEPERQQDLLTRMLKLTGRPMHIALGVNDDAEDWARARREEGLPVVPERMGIYAESRFSLAEFNQFDYMPAWAHALVGTPEERAAKLRIPEVREAMKEDAAIPLHARTKWENTTVLQVEHERNYKYEGRRIHEVAAEEGKHPVDFLVDLALDEGLLTEFSFKNDGAENQQRVAAGIRDPYTHISVSDGGAHTRFSTLSRWPVDFLSNQIRDREVVSLERAHYKISAYPAWVAGYNNRGVLRPGKAADIMIYDLDELGLLYDAPVYSNDFPGGERRLVQMPKGIRFILVNGAVTFEENVCTNALPGKLLRSYEECLG